jgi:glucose/mannose transport system substrate-binding protein
MRTLAAAMTALAFVASAPFAGAEELEVLHYWTSGGESKAVNVLKEVLEKKGHQWKDSAIAGGGGQNAMTVLKTRVVAGTPPAVVQMRGPSVQEWAAEGALANLDPVAGTWAKDLPPAIDEVLKYEGSYYAAPHWIHRVNWMYINKPLLDEVGGQVPTTWDKLFAVADKMKAAGKIPIAHGATPYHDAVYFEGIVQSMGVDFYRKSILEGDQEALTSDTMVNVFEILRKSTEYFDRGVQGRPWNIAASMVIEGKAGFLFMGDWAKGEFSVAGKQAGKDFICAPRPGNEGIFTFIADTFVFFQQQGGDATAGQLELAALIESPAYQEKAALYKGAIPALKTAKLNEFDSCAQKSAADMQSAAALNQLVPSQNQGTTEARLGAIRDVVTKFMYSDQSAKDGAAALAAAIQAAG